MSSVFYLSQQCYITTNRHVHIPSLVINKCVITLVFCLAQLWAAPHVMMLSGWLSDQHSGRYWLTLGIITQHYPAIYHAAHIRAALKWWTGMFWLCQKLSKSQCLCVHLSVCQAGTELSKSLNLLLSLIGYRSVSCLCKLSYWHLYNPRF